MNITTLPADLKASSHASALARSWLLPEVSTATAFGGVLSFM